MSFVTEMDVLPLAGLRERAEQGSLTAARESVGQLLDEVGRQRL